MSRLYLGLAGILIIVASVYLVATRLPVSATNGVGSTWGGAGSLRLFFSAQNTEEIKQRPTTKEVLQEQPEIQQLIFSPTGIAIEDEQNEGFDLADLLSQLTQGSSANSSATVEGPDFSSIYSFIPQGFISTSTSVLETRTDTQQALFEYGNSVGSYLRGFEDSHTTMLTTLKNAHEDRGNSTKVEAAAQIGRDYIAFGNDLHELTPVPASAVSVHKAFADAHIEVGENLMAVVYAKDDAAFLDAIDVYNATVEAYAKEYVALATLFQASGVTFGSHDAGSVFAFNSSLSL